jgi:U4/U6.U5 tri-snRNP component SNU23
MSKRKQEDAKDAMGRRVWDKQFFKEQYEAGITQPLGASKKVVRAATESLKQRTEEVSIEERVNEKRIVTNSTVKNLQGGFYCETCDCLLKDSTAYLDHINGRSHNRLLGMTMNVEQVSVERVIEKMKRIRQGLDS